MARERESLAALAAVPRGVKRFLIGRAVAALTRPVTLYSPSEVTNLQKLRKRLRVGDVLLVAGDARISHVVKVLTLSQWSHVMLYVGDRRDLLSPAEVEEWTAEFGAQSLKHLVVDADPLRGVHLKPLDHSVGLMIRQCRPEALHPADRERVIEIALSQLGRGYDIQHIIRLLFFFAFPWELLPESGRRFVTDFTLSEDDRICSRVLSQAFHSVGYPIRPRDVIENRGATFRRALGVAAGLKHRGRSTLRLLAGGRVRAAFGRLTAKRYEQFHLKGTRYITPADYDLSRFFSVLKDPEDLAVDYRSATGLTPQSSGLSGPEQE